MVLTIAAMPAVAMAQSVDSPSPDASSGAQSAGGGGGRHGHRNRQANADSPSSPPIIERPKLKPDPLQRLDAGALLCGTEAELRQHQAALMARMQGHEAQEPTGCRIVQDMTAVSVVDRDGPARTHVRLGGQNQNGGWTDAIVRDE
jgi:hypothetical protein